MKTPIFDRIRQIDLAYKDFGELPLRRDIVARLKRLERITVSKINATPTEADVKKVVDAVPACRLASAPETKDKRIELELTTGSVSCLAVGAPK